MIRTLWPKSYAALLFGVRFSLVLELSFSSKSFW